MSEQSAEYHAGFEDGLAAVMAIRCTDHRAFPQFNENAGGDGECAVCAVNAATADLRQVLLQLLQWDHLDGSADGPYWRAEIEKALGIKTDPDADAAARQLERRIAESS